jgi:hypothetical protein
MADMIPLNGGKKTIYILKGQNTSQEYPRNIYTDNYRTQVHFIEPNQASKQSLISVCFWLT